MINDDSRFNYSPIMRVLGEHGGPIENARVHMPYPRESVINAIRTGDVFEYAVREADTWSNIAARFLKGRSDLWWIIGELSGVVDPFTELRVGTLLKIPSFEAVMFNVLNFDSDGPPPGETGGGETATWAGNWWKSGPAGRGAP